MRATASRALILLLLLFPHDPARPIPSMIDISPLHRAVAQLEGALAYANSDLASGNADLAPHLRAAAIQAFEFTYELSIKMLRRYLAEASPSPSTVEELDFSGLVRMGLAAGLLQEEIEAWRGFRLARGITSHTYDEAKAQSVFASIPRFLAEARYLLGQIDMRQKAP